MTKKTILIAQMIISFLMATLMSGIMSLISMGPSAEWLAHWPLAIITAWPIAFVLSLMVSPLAFFLAKTFTRDHAA